MNKQLINLILALIAIAIGIKALYDNLQTTKSNNHAIDSLKTEIEVRNQVIYLIKKDYNLQMVGRHTDSVYSEYLFNIDDTPKFSICLESSSQIRELRELGDLTRQKQWSFDWRRFYYPEFAKYHDWKFGWNTGKPNQFIYDPSLGAGKAREIDSIDYFNNLKQSDYGPFGSQGLSDRRFYPNSKTPYFDSIAIIHNDLFKQPLK